MTPMNGPTTSRAVRASPSTAVSRLPYCSTASRTTADFDRPWALARRRSRASVWASRRRLNGMSYIIVGHHETEVQGSNTTSHTTLTVARRQAWYSLHMSLTRTVSPNRTPRRSGGTGSMAGANPNRFNGVSWITAVFMALFHVGAVWALIDFTWSGVVVLLATYYVALAWGIGMSYHRLLTHRSYKAPKIVEYFLTICATTALEGGPLF